MTNPSTTVTPFSNLSVGADGTVYAVDKNQRVWRWNGTVWQEPTPGIRLAQVAVGNVQSVWGINANQEIFQLVGSTWTRPEPANARAIRIAVGGDGTVWVVNAAGEMYQRQGNTWVQPEPKAARAIQVAVGNANNVWCVNAQNFVFQRAYVGSNYNWIQGDPTLARSKHVSVANDGSVWIVRPDGQLWQYWNNQWIHPEPRNVVGLQVEVGNSNTVWYLDVNGLPYRRVGNNQWQSIALPLPAPPPAPDYVYTVQPGDTLNAIATLFGVTANAIMGANNLINPNMIVVNQKLKIPGLPPLTITADMPSYTVQYGDTLRAIASSFGVNLGVLLRLNNISDPRTLATGTILRFPKGSTVPPIYGGGTPIQYTVQAGDTLASIAGRYGVTTQALLQANNLPNETWIRVGQILNIPSGGSTPTTPTNYFTYIVQPGDALSLIAQRFGVTIEAIMRANNLVNPNLIVVGQVLYVPQTNVTPTGPVNPGNYRTYVVQPGDSLASIAARFAVTLETIMRANNLPSANALLVGQTLLIPATGSTPTGPITPGGSTTYVIQTGDTLAAIATRFGVTTQAIMKINNLPNETWIRVGQILNIPPRGTGTGTTTVTTTTTTATNPLTGGGSGNKYVVQPGDSVAGIAQKFGITTQALMQANGLTSPNFLIVGTVLTIPAGGVVAPTSETTSQMPASTTIPTSPMPPVTPSQPSTPSTPSSSAGRSYTVQKGDTLKAIAAKFGVPMETIMKRNKLITPTAIKVGQVLVIP